MLLVSFGHPLTPANLAQIAALTGSEPEVRAVRVQIDNSQSLAEQTAALVDAMGVSGDAWQTTPLIVNPPGLAVATAALLAEIHGRSGHFPAVLRLRPVEGAPVATFEVAEIVNLQALRDKARERR